MKKFAFVFLFSILIFSNSLYSQNVLEIEPLFEYPVPPDECESLTERCEYLVKNFWNNFDFKKKEPVDQHALNAAFGVYASAIRFASKKEVDQSIDKLLKTISSNPTQLLQFTKAAQENFYGPRAEAWSDEVYLRFLDPIIKNKKLPEKRKATYVKQAQILNNSRVGEVFPSFSFMDRNDEKKQYFPMSTPTLMIFGNPDDIDWKLSKIKMDSNLQLNDALEKGKINILYIVPFDLPDWKKATDTYNSHIIVGQAKELGDVVDIRLTPSIYIIGSDGKILNKFLTPERAVSTILELVNN